LERSHFLNRNEEVQSDRKDPSDRTMMSMRMMHHGQLHVLLHDEAVVEVAVVSCFVSVAFFPSLCSS
jgi:hypothetical protein